MPNAPTLPHGNPPGGVPSAPQPPNLRGAGEARPWGPVPGVPTWGAERRREEREAGLAVLRLRVPGLNAVGQAAGPRLRGAGSGDKAWGGVGWGGMGWWH